MNQLKEISVSINISYNTHLRFKHLANSKFLLIFLKSFFNIILKNTGTVIFFYLKKDFKTAVLSLNFKHKFFYFFKNYFSQLKLLQYDFFLNKGKFSRNRQQYKTGVF